MKTVINKYINMCYKGNTRKFTENKLFSNNFIHPSQSYMYSGIYRMIAIFKVK